jgi:SAM-dependent methyltransferase
MFEHVLTARQAWRSVFDVFGVDASAALIVGGGPAESVADMAPLPVVDAEPRLVSLGSGPPLDAGASPTDTFLDDATIDAAVMLGSWRDPELLRTVVAECARVVRPGGIVVVGRPDADRLAGSSPSRYPSAIVARMVPRPDADPSIPETGPTVSVELAMVRARLRAISVTGVELPVAVLASADAYVDAVLDGLWPGIEGSTANDSQELVSVIRDMLKHEEFPIVERQPWLLASGTRP